MKLGNKIDFFYRIPYDVAPAWLQADTSIKIDFYLFLQNIKMSIEVQAFLNHELYKTSKRLRRTKRSK